MKKMLFTAALACAALGMPAPALADDAMSPHPAMMGHATSATMLCRPAAANEKPTAMMIGSAKAALVCKTIPGDMMKKSAGPDLSHALSADQVDAAWRKFVSSMIAVPATGGG